MLHTPIITLETVLQAHRQRRARMAENAVADDGVIHPRQRRPKYVRRYEVETEDDTPVPAFSYHAFFERAARLHPLPKPFKVSLFDGIEEMEELIEIKKAPTVETVQRFICARYGISMLELLSMRRTANIVRPRQIAMYLAKVLTIRSLPEIGRRFNGKDHTTVLHAVRKIGLLMEESAEFAAEIEQLQAQIAAEAQSK